MIWYDIDTIPAADPMPAIPDFLRRERSADYVAPRLSFNPPRIWIMPGETKKAEPMTIPYPISNPALPVEIWIRDGKSPAKNFPSLAAFYAWYRPKVNGYLGARETSHDIIVFLENADTKEDAAPLVRTQAKDKPSNAPPKPGAGVIADGKPYRSVLAAFEALKLPIPKHQKFRAALKKAGELTFDYADHKVHFKTGSS